MDLAIQLATNDEIIREETIRDLKDYNSKSLLTQSKRGENLVAMLSANKKKIQYLLGDEIIELGTRNNILKNKVSECDH